MTDLKNLVEPGSNGQSFMVNIQGFFHGMISINNGANCFDHAYGIVMAVKATDNISLTEGLSYEASLFALVCGTEDFKEGTKAVLEKTKPVFKHR